MKEATMDAEISAMNRIAKMLGELGEEERQRVVAWVGRKFGPECKVAHPASVSEKVPSGFVGIDGAGNAHVSGGGSVGQVKR
jgi:hypothetical protein